MKRVRCAIYTRKSSEEGLEQDFNSLDAQREACAAYVLSQASEGWTLNPEAYDDCGISGGTLERPGLQRLLADIADGKIDIVVVYKVDRLTRSLLDFSRLVEAFDAAETSFVSVTQSFNTTTSMGRLTLNMLLSFAQFEREVTAERIRDKIAASKAKGMWMGGTPPLGYRPDGRSLAIVEQQASLVRDIYARYLRLGNVRLLAEQLRADGIRTPVRQRENGRQFGGGEFTRGQLYALLKNPIYAGRIVHKGETFAGLHPAIIDAAQWEAVQSRLADHVRGERSGRAPHSSLLAGKIVDGSGQGLIAAHATKGKVRYRYYVSRDAHHQAAAGALRIPAREIENLVTTRVADLFQDGLTLLGRLGIEASPANITRVLQRCGDLAVTLKAKPHGDIGQLVEQVRIGEGQVEIDVSRQGLADLLEVNLAEPEPACLTLTEALQLTRTGRVVRLVDRNGQTALAQPPDSSLTAMVITARKWWAQLSEGEVNVKQLARQEGVSQSWMTRVVRLAFLAPSVIEAILNGALRPEIDSKALLSCGAIPGSWREQQERLLVGR